MDILCAVRTMVLLAIIIPAAASAQSPRRVLLERFTNVRSEEVAELSAPYQYLYLGRDDIRSVAIPITYHTNTPENDPIRDLYPQSHDSRTAYYSPSDIPSVYVNGKLPEPSSSGGHAGALNDTAAISREIDKIRGTMSPLTITIEGTYDYPAATAVVKVRSSEDMSGKRVYVLLMDDYASYPEMINYEYGSYNIVRKIAPVEGHELTLAAGESKTFTAMADIGPGPDFRDLYFVAFVQDTMTKEILQAAENLVSPLLAFAQPGTIIQPDDNPVEWAGTLGTTHDGTYRMDANLGLPDGWSTSFRLDGVEIQPGTSFDLVAGTPKSFHMTITPSPTTPMRTSSIFLQLIPEQGVGNSWIFTAHSGAITALLIPRSEGDRSIINAWEHALQTSQTRYAFVNIWELPLFDMANHVAVVEYGKAAMTAYDTLILGAALDNGMRLFISGAEVAYGLADPANTGPDAIVDTAFLRRHFHVEYVNDNANSPRVYGVAGDPVAAGVEPLITNGIQTQDTPDLLHPRDGAIPIFYYNAGRTEVAGIRYADAKNRLIYLGFGLRSFA